MPVPIATTERPDHLAATEPGCGACPHSTADHDAIGLRFCRATRESTLGRGCVCRVP